MRDELRQEGTTKQGSAHRRNPVWAKRSGESGNEGIDPMRLCKQGIEVQPKTAMVARLKPKVAAPSGD